MNAWGRTPTVYLAGSSAETERIERWASKLREAGVTPLCSWITAVAQSGGNPRDAPTKQRRLWAASNLTEVAQADAVWFLVPTYPAVTRGAWFEAGFAHAFAKQVLFSGDTKQSVFCALGAEYAEDEDAFQAVLGWVQAGGHV